MTSIVSEAVFTADEISPIIDQLQGQLINVKRGPAIVALLSMCIMLQNPNLGMDDLQDIVKETSQFICMMLDDSDSVPDEDKKRMN